MTTTERTNRPGRAPDRLRTTIERGYIIPYSAENSITTDGVIFMCRMASALGIATIAGRVFL